MRGLLTFPFFIAVSLLCGSLALAADPVAGAQPNPVAEFLQTIVTVAGFVALAAGIVYGLINRKNYDKLNETITELKAINESKDNRLLELKLQLEATTAKLTLDIQRLRSDVERLEVSNEAVTAMNLQMKGILRELRLAGKWEGHEDAVIGPR